VLDVVEQGQVGLDVPGRGGQQQPHHAVAVRRVAPQVRRSRR
jgi:hypothetical protein